MRRNVIADELITVGLIITQSPQCAHTFPIAVETLCRLRFLTEWTKRDADVLQHGETARVAALPFFSPKLSCEPIAQQIQSLRNPTSSGL